MSVLETATNKALAEGDYITALRREFHANPEVSLREFWTATRIEEELDRLGIAHERSGETGVYASIRGKLAGDGVIALRADTDALPITETHEVPYKSQNDGVMHACGHDSHTAILLGAAKVLADSVDEFGGEVRFFFQPGEEVGGGAKEFIRDGHLEGVERVFGLHAASDLPVGKTWVTPGSNNAAVDLFRVEVEGTAAHVSTPQLGADALYVASQIVVAAQALSTRRHSPTEPLIIGIGRLDAGTAYNIVAHHAVIEGTTRTLTPQTRASVKEEITALAEATARIYGATAHVDWTDITPALINPADVAKEVEAQARAIPGATVDTARPVSLGGDNFAEYQQVVPGFYAFLGTRNPANPNTALPHHNDGFDLGEDAFPLGAALHVRYALWWLTEGRLAKQGADTTIASADAAGQED